MIYFADNIQTASSDLKYKTNKTETDCLKRRLYQHSRNLKIDNPDSPLCQHRSAFNHRINLSGTSLIYPCGDYLHRRFVESYFTSKFNNLNRDKGFFNIDGFTGSILNSSSFGKKFKKHSINLNVTT